MKLESHLKIKHLLIRLEAVHECVDLLKVRLLLVKQLFSLVYQLGFANVLLKTLVYL